MTGSWCGSNSCPLGGVEHFCGPAGGGNAKNARVNTKKGQQKASELAEANPIDRMTLSCATRTLALGTAMVPHESLQDPSDKGILNYTLDP